LKVKAKGENAVERAKWLTRVRDSEGYMAQFLPSEKRRSANFGMSFPVFNLLEKYPIIGRLEQDMFEGVLGTSVRREENAHKRTLRVRILFRRLIRCRSCTARFLLSHRLISVD